MQRVFLTLLGPGSKGRPRVFCATQTLLCTGATPFRTSARGLLLAGSRRPLAPSPNHFRELSLFGQFPRSTASQGKSLDARLTWWTFRRFFFFSVCCLGRGKGESKAPEGGGIVFFFSFENPRRRVSRRGRGRGAGRVYSVNGGIFGGGGPNIYFGGRNVHQAKGAYGNTAF